jgi:hypothetical protein
MDPEDFRKSRPVTIPARVPYPDFQWCQKRPYLTRQPRGAENGLGDASKVVSKGNVPSTPSPSVLTRWPDGRPPRLRQSQHHRAEKRTCRPMPSRLMGVYRCGPTRPSAPTPPPAAPPGCSTPSTDRRRPRGLATRQARSESAPSGSHRHRPLCLRSRIPFPHRRHLVSSTTTESTPSGPSRRCGGLSRHQYRSSGLGTEWRQSTMTFVSNTRKRHWADSSNVSMRHRRSRIIGGELSEGSRCLPLVNESPKVAEGGYGRDAAH